MSVFWGENLLILYIWHTKEMDSKNNNNNRLKDTKLILCSISWSTLYVANLLILFVI